jgi:hypothetical protein
MLAKWEGGKGGGELHMKRVLYIAVLLAGAFTFALLTPPPATADPFTPTDIQYLASLNHGGLCCPEQLDTPVWYATPAEAIYVGHRIAKAMTANPTYAQFQTLRNQLGVASRSAGQRPLDGFEAGQVVVIAVHYYAGPEIECQLMKEMGGAVGEAPYWYGPVTYSGGLAVQPGCIDFSR